MAAPVLAPIITLPQEMAAGLEPLAGPAVGGASGGGFTRGPALLPDPSPVPGVPAPDTWALLIAGFGFVGMALRRQPKPASTRDR